MAELERNVIRERVQAGLAYARQHGTKSGKAIGRPKAVFDRAKIAALLGEGLSLRQIAGRLGVGATTVRRVWNASEGSKAVRQNPPVRPGNRAIETKGTTAAVGQVMRD